MTQDATDDLDLTAPSKPLEVREVLPTPNGPNEALNTIYTVCTGKPYLGNTVAKDAITEVGVLQRERDQYKLVLKMIADRPRVDPTNPESLSDVGEFAWKTARRLLKVA